MRFEPTPVAGVFVVEPEPFADARGFFAEIWKPTEAARHGIQEVFIRSNLSYNKQRGILRGLHGQKPPYAEAKLVRCIRGAIYDVAVDIRPESPTYRQWVAVELSADNRRALFIPRGCLHGFQTLTDHSEVLYECSALYHPASEIGARYDDPAFGIEWPEPAEKILSEKDRHWAPFEAAIQA